MEAQFGHLQKVVIVADSVILSGAGAVSRSLPAEAQRMPTEGDHFLKTLRDVFAAETGKMKKVPGMPEEVFTANPQTLASLNISGNINKLL